MEKTGYRVPLSVTISRKTGQVTKIDWCEDATEGEFRRMCEWMKEAGERALEARRQDDTENKEVKRSRTDFVAGCATR